VFDIEYPLGRQTRLVNVNDQLRHDGGVRTQGIVAQTARWRDYGTGKDSFGRRLECS